MVVTRRPYSPRKKIIQRKDSGSLGLHCPSCDHPETGVLDSRFHTPHTYRRRRECISCHARFTTVEIVAMDLDEATARVGQVLDNLRTPLSRKMLRVQNLLDALLTELEQ